MSSIIRVRNGVIVCSFVIDDGTTPSRRRRYLRRPVLGDPATPYGAAVPFNTKISALQVVLRYRNLLAVEDAFRTAKALLATRPIFHKTDTGIRGHVFCTFLALVLRKELLDRLAARRSKLEWQRIIDDLADLSEIEVEQDGRRARLRTAPGPTIDPICRAVGLTLPPVFQEMPPTS